MIQLVIVHPRKFQKISASLPYSLNSIYTITKFLQIEHLIRKHFVSGKDRGYGRIIEILAQESDKYYRNKQYS